MWEKRGEIGSHSKGREAGQSKKDYNTKKTCAHGKADGARASEKSPPKKKKHAKVTQPMKVPPFLSLLPSDLTDIMDVWMMLGGHQKELDSIQ